MNEKNLNKKIIDIFREKEKVNIGYIVAGYPSVDFTKQFLQNLDNTALDMLEVGIPYSISQGDGFIYAIGSLGVTGSKQVDLPRLESFINEIREVSDLPVSLGFGIKNNDNVNTMRKYADGVIVGTSIVEFLERNDVNYLIQKINELFE